MKILRYVIKYQDSNIAVVRLFRKEILDFLKNSKISIEEGEGPHSFWDRVEEALLEVFGVFFVIIDVSVARYEITVIKDSELQNWGRIIEDVIWCSVLFFNPDGGAIQVSKYDKNKNIGKLITQSFGTIEPEYPHRDKRDKK